jgi:hypothetical protein
MVTIKSINWTYITEIGSLECMDGQDQSQEFEMSGEPSIQECECPDPCNCDHENE